MVCPKCEHEMLWHSEFDLEDDDGTPEGIIGSYSCINRECDVRDVFIHTYNNLDEANR